MMPKAIKKIVSVCGAVVLAFGVIAASSFSPATAAIAEAGSYYATITSTGGNELLGQVHDLITTTHTYYTSYDDCKNPEYVKRTDPGPNGQLMEFYAQAELSATWEFAAPGTWNREHVWCKSLSNNLWNKANSGCGSDLLHIRPTESRLNTDRDNDRYGNVIGGTEIWYVNKSGVKVALGGYEKGTVFEPIDTVKGDVARIIMYVYTHYNTFENIYGTTNGNGSPNFFGTLNFTKIIAATSENAAIQILLEWHNSDPVDGLELARNEAAQEIQGNRNPFVDHPEYAEAIWGDEPLGGGSQSNKHLDDFHAAVEGIVTEGSLALRLASLKKAANALLALTESEKESASGDVATLNEAIDNYNKYVASLNGDAESANKAAIDSAGEFLNR